VARTHGMGLKSISFRPILLGMGVRVDKGGLQPRARKSDVAPKDERSRQ